MKVQRYPYNVAIPPDFSPLDIETSCMEEKNKRDQFMQLVLGCLVS